MDWQVGTGPAILPDLSAPPEEWSHKFKLAHIAFRTPFRADFIVDQPTSVQPDQAEVRVGEGDNEELYLTYHYSDHVHKTVRSVLLALDEVVKNN